MRPSALILILAFLMLAGCTTFHGVTPLSPEAGNPNRPQLTDSLQPVFRWEPAPEAGVTYDLIVYDGIKIESFIEGVKRSVGKEIYYRTGLTKAEHQMEEPLKPGSEYYWSVRKRLNDTVTAWTTYDYTLFLVTAYVRITNRLFIFRTPDNH